MSDQQYNQHPVSHGTNPPRRGTRFKDDPNDAPAPRPQSADTPGSQGAQCTLGVSGTQVQQSGSTRVQKMIPSASSDLSQAARAARGSGATKPQKLSRKNLIILFVVLIVLVCGILFAVSRLTSVFFSHEATTISQELASEPATITVESGDNWHKVAHQLAEARLITDEAIFLNLVKQMDVVNDLKPGVYTVEPTTDLADLIGQFVAGAQTAKVTVPEGKTVAQTAAIVEKATEGGISAEDFLAAAKASRWVDQFPFLADAYDDSLEGYLFPKTYPIAPNMTADQIIETMLKQYEKETKNLTYEAVTSRGLSERDLIIIASLIERESAATEERPTIASVIYNRLDKGMNLQLCASVVYAMGSGSVDHVTLEDLKIDSPYNTYQTKGLPPGPICSPSLSSLEAAANPESTSYLFYVAKGDGTHSFTDDYSQFTSDKADYWNLKNR